MTTSAQGNQDSATIIRLRPAKATRSSDEKWGAAVMKVGFSIVPSLLLRAQRRLRLTPTQLAVLLQLSDYWWDERRKPFPSKESLADRLGLSPRQVQDRVPGRGVRAGDRLGHRRRWLPGFTQRRWPTARQDYRSTA